MSDFAKNLRRYRKRKNYSQEKLAKELHYGYTAIANYESGRNEPSIDDLIRLAKALNVTVDELIGMKFTSKEEKLTGAITSEDAVVVDGNIITSRGMGTAIDFGLAIVDCLTDFDEEVVEHVKKGIVYRNFEEV